MFWIALAAQVTAATPQNLRNWFAADDMPSRVMAAGTGMSLVSIRVVVKPDGGIQDCTVEVGARASILNALSCDIVRRRANFVPARWSDGSPGWGVYRTSVSWIVAEAPFDLRRVSNPDVEVSVQALPTGVKDPSLVRVMLAVEANRSIASCSPNSAESFERAENVPALVPIACEQLKASYQPVVVVDTAGKPVRSVQDALVGFTTHQR